MGVGEYMVYNNTNLIKYLQQLNAEIINTLTFNRLFFFLNYKNLQSSCCTYYTYLFNMLTPSITLPLRKKSISVVAIVTCNLK